MTDTSVDIRLMTPGDIPFATEMTDIEKWGNLPADFGRLLALNPEGCFVACKDGRQVGMITSTRYGHFAFLASLIVRESERGHGIGATLMRHAMKYLRESGITTVELDGELKATPLYRRLGFKDKYLSLRFFRPAEKSHTTKSDQGGGDSAPNVLKDELVAYDRSMTGLERGHVISRFADEFAGSFFSVRNQGMTGYAFVRPIADNRMQIGPLVSSSSESTAELISRIISRYGAHGLHLGAPEVTHRTQSNRDFASILLRNGFEYRPPSLRMYLGERIEYEKHICAIISPEKG